MALYLGHRRRRLHRIASGRRARCGAASRCASSTTSRRASARTCRPGAASSSSKATSRIRPSPTRAVAGVRLRAAPGGDSVRAAVGAGPASRPTAPTSTARLQVLVAARDARVKRVVFAGSSSVYGDTAVLPKREDMPTESAVAVRAAEARRRAVLPAVHAALRPRDRHDPVLQRVRAAAGSGLAVFGRDLALHQRAASRDARRTIYGDGRQTRDFTYVADVVDGVLRCCEAPNVRRRGDQRRGWRARLAAAS